jgi:hypothetical protein
MGFPSTTVFLPLADLLPTGLIMEYSKGDTFTVTNTCDGTSISRIVEDDYSYIGIPNGSTYIGNGISPSDTDPPY